MHKIHLELRFENEKGYVEVLVIFQIVFSNRSFGAHQN